MNLERERQLLRLVEEALAWPVETREARLRAELAHDPSMLEEVRAMLTAADSVHESLPTRMPLGPPLDEAPPPERLGPYRITGLLGQGGMGRVFRAERADGVFEQTIAIKLMRRTRLPEQVAGQFARERQILARLRHPNIAQLFDGGVTPEGLSYFVMELVEGRAISQYAVEERLTVRQLLKVFRQVCAAVQYAHAHLVVHGDIKPNNIFITSEGVAKLLDFGVARVIEDTADAQSTPITAVGVTHYYASPARRSGAAPTTADDIYSLGFLLGELLNRIDGVDADIRSIVTRAMAADPAQRYASVDALDADIERWLNGVPVRAHGRAWGYVTGRFLARHRVGVVSAATAVLLLVGAAIAMSIMYVRAEHARSQAERRFTEVRDLSRYVLFDVYDRMESVPRALTLRRDIAEKGQQYLDRLSRDPDAPADVRLEVAEGLRRLSLVQGGVSSASLANVKIAETNLARAEQIARTLPDDARYGRERAFAITRILIARSRVSTGVSLDLQATNQSLDAAEAALAPWLAKDPPDRLARDLGIDLALERIAQFLWQGKYNDAIAIARKGIALESPVVPSEPDARRGALRKHAELLDGMAEAIYYLGDLPASEAAYREHYKLMRDLAEEEPQNLGAQRRYMRAGWALGGTLLEMGPTRQVEAEQLLGKSLALADNLRLLEPDDKDLLRMRSVVAAAEAQALAGVGRAKEAVPLMEEAVGQRKALWNEASGDWAIARDVATSLDMFGGLLLSAHETKRACAIYQESLDVFAQMRAAGRLTQLDEDTIQKEARQALATHCPGSTSTASR
ncbi:MAG: serine/threonine-protein kinase [Gammaproteobacteria bacterium]